MPRAVEMRGGGGGSSAAAAAATAARSAASCSAAAAAAAAVAARGTGLLCNASCCCCCAGAALRWSAALPAAASGPALRASSISASVRLEAREGGAEPAARWLTGAWVAPTTGTAPCPGCCCCCSSLRATAAAMAGGSGGRAGCGFTSGTLRCACRSVAAWPSAAVAASAGCSQNCAWPSLLSGAAWDEPSWAAGATCCCSAELGRASSSSARPAAAAAAAPAAWAPPMLNAAKGELGTAVGLAGVPAREGDGGSAPSPPRCRLALGRGHMARTAASWLLSLLHSPGGVSAAGGAPLLLARPEDEEGSGESARRRRRGVSASSTSPSGWRGMAQRGRCGAVLQRTRASSAEACTACSAGAGRS